MNSRRREPVAILGAGLAGLVAANELQRRSIPFRLFEAGKQIAGLAKSFRDEAGFSYDFGAHFITNRLAAALGTGGRRRNVRLYR
jgi:protoporphyrinogen/coproporphyrinogen III oxidase